MPDGVGVFATPTVPVPVLVIDPVTDVANVTAIAVSATTAAPARTPVEPAAGSGDDRGGSGAERDEPRGDVLLVPGFTGSKEDFIALLRPLAERGWRVAAMDLPGQGGALGLGGRGAHTPQSLADVVGRVADWFSPEAPVHLVGHSMGGLVTREVVIARPERVSSWVPMCSGPGPVPDTQFATLRGLQLGLARLPIEQVWAQKEAMDRAGGWLPPSEEVAAFVASRFVRNDPDALADFAEILMTAEDRTDLAAAGMAHCGVGGAVLTGETDDAWPLAQQEAMARRLGVPWVVVPGVGHNPGVEDPEATAAALDRIFRAADGARS